MIKQAQLDEVLGCVFLRLSWHSKGIEWQEGLVDGASMVFMSSIAGLGQAVGMTGYSAAKAAIDGMVRSIACEYAAI